MIVNTKSIVQHVIQIKNGIMLNANASVQENIVHVQKIIVGIRTHVFVRTAGI